MSKVYYGKKKSPATLIIIMTCVLVILIGGLLAFVGKGYSKITEESKRLVSENKDLIKNNSDLKNKNNNLSTVNVDLINRLDSKTQETKRLNNENQVLSDRNDILTEEKETLTVEKEDLINRLDSKTQENNKLVNDNQLLTTENEQLINQVDNLTDEKNTLSEKNSELQEKLDAQSKFKIENRRTGYEVFLYSQGSMIYSYGSWNFEQNRVLSLANLYSEFFNNFSQTERMGLIHSTIYDLKVFNETENRYEVICNFTNSFESEDISPDDVDFSFVTNYSDNITEERKNMIENNIDDGASIEFLPTLDLSINEDGRYTVIFSLNILSAWV